MGSWDIDPAGVSHVLSAVQNRADDLQTALTSTAEDLQAAGFACGQSLVAVALSGFAGARAPAVAAATGHLESAVSGAAKATMAYVHGDEQMAANAQAAAAGAPVPGVAGGHAVPR